MLWNDQRQTYEKKASWEREMEKADAEFREKKRKNPKWLTKMFDNRPKSPVDESNIKYHQPQEDPEEDVWAFLKEKIPEDDPITKLRKDE